MTRFTAALWIVPALAAQLATDVFTKAPPAVEEALRARIRQFYQLQVEGKGRRAEALVAEDTKDYYYNAGQPKYVAFKIERIEWAPDFTKAKATVVCDTYVMMPGFAGKPLPVPTASYWKLENGEWFWYVDEKMRNRTPFGDMKPGEGGTAPAALPALPTPEEAVRMIQQVKADKAAVKLDPAKESTGQVTLTNPLTGAVKIRVNAPEVPGLQILAEPSIAPGQKATVTFRYRPGKTQPAAAVAATIEVETTGQSFPVRIEFGK